MRLLHIIPKLLAFLPLLLTMAEAVGQNGNTVHAGQTTTLSVVETDGVTYTWDLYNDIEGIDLAHTAGNCPDNEAYFADGISTGSSVDVVWLQEGTYYFKVTARDDCSNNMKLGKIIVVSSHPAAHFLEPEEPVCIGDTVELVMELTGAGPWSVTYTDGTDIYTIDVVESSPHSVFVTPNELGEYIYTVLSVTDTNGVTNDEPSQPVAFEVHPRPVTSPIERYDPLSKKE